MTILSSSSLGTSRCSYFADTKLPLACEVIYLIIYLHCVDTLFPYLGCIHQDRHPKSLVRLRICPPKPRTFRCSYFVDAKLPLASGIIYITLHRVEQFFPYLGCIHQDRHPKSLVRLRICMFVTVKCVM